MSLSVMERARRIATFRFVEVRLMEMAACWTPTTPEMEVKVVLGRHIWDFAQHADALGKRTFELRHPEQYSLRPVESYARLLDEVRQVEPTAARLSSLYDVILPGLAARYAAYVDETDPILDSPSVLIIERIMLDLERQRADADSVRRDLGLAVSETAALRRRETSVHQLVEA